MKVFLVEDESMMRSGIKNNMPWEREGFEIVGDAANGMQAYPMIRQKQPDILITDIFMPCMDGLKLSRLVKTELPHIKILALSERKEFQHIQRAISIGITDFLPKPVDSGELMKAVKNAAADLIKEEAARRKLERFREKTEENRRLQKYKLLLAVLSGTMPEQEILGQGKRLGIDFQGSEFAVLLFGMRSHTNIPADQEAEKCIRECIKELKHTIAVDRGRDGWVLLIKGDRLGSVNDRLNLCCTRLTEVLQPYREVSFFGGIGRTVSSLSHIPYSCRDAEKAFSGRHFQDQNQFVYCCKEEGGLQRKEFYASLLMQSKEARCRLYHFLRNGLCGEEEAFVNSYLDAVGEGLYKFRVLRQYVTLDVYLGVITFLDGIGAEACSLSAEASDINRAAENIHSRDSLKAYLRMLLKEAVELRDEQSGEKYGFSVKRSLAYIDTFYSRSDLSLNTVAAHLKISPGYFSSLFHQKMGKTFVEYLTGVRMEHAKKQLCGTDKKLSQIGYEAGYQDNHYFSYIFKKTQGCTPSEYRKRNRKQR